MALIKSESIPGNFGIAAVSYFARGVSASLTFRIYLFENSSSENIHEDSFPVLFRFLKSMLNPTFMKIGMAPYMHSD